MQNAERRMHCLLAVSFPCLCLRLAFICWKGQHFIVVGPFQQIKANRKQTQMKLTASKQCIRRSAFGVRRSAFGVLPLPRESMCAQSPSPYLSLWHKIEPKLASHTLSLLCSHLVSLKIAKKRTNSFISSRFHCIRNWKEIGKKLSKNQSAVNLY